MGITPAYAGKRMGMKPKLTFDEDHPRIRGEKTVATPGTNTTAGSPPHTRGKGQRKYLRWFPRRITPAYAGKRLFIKR